MPKTKSIGAALATLVVLALDATATADDDGNYSRPGPYIGVSAAFADPQFDKKDIERHFLFDQDYESEELDIEVGNGWGVGAVIGYRMLRYLAFEAQYEHISSIKFESAPGVDRQTLRANALTANVKLVVPDVRIQPYLLAGIGGVRYVRKDRRFIDPLFAGAGWALAGRLGGGFDAYLTENLVLNAAIAIVLTDADFTPQPGDFDIDRPHYLSIGTGLQYRF